MKLYTIGILIVLTVSASLPGMAADAAEKEGRIDNLVVLLTDYGTTDFYVGALEGSIYSANPEARISTITHEVRAFDVAEGSYILAQAAQDYPSGTVFAAEVDPGVGTLERLIVLETPDDKLFVGPDNGILTGVMDEIGTSHIYEIANESLMRNNAASATFNGMAVYGPVAAHLAGGASPSDVGPEIFDPVRIDVSKPGLEGGNVVGTIVHVDHWGNLVTNPRNLILQQSQLCPFASVIHRSDYPVHHPMAALTTKK